MSLLRSSAEWFDTTAADADDSDEIEWVRVLPFVAMHLACLAVFWVGWSTVALYTALAAYVLRMFFVTAFYHRYFAHRSYTTSRLAQFLFALLGNTAVQRGPLWWAAHHRKHHKHADRAGDPHSPDPDGFLWSHLLWLTTRRSFRTDVDRVRDLARYPELRFLDRFDVFVPVVFAAAMFAFGHVAPASWGTSSWQILVWGFFVSTVVLFHATSAVNSLAHTVGSRRYDTPDTSRNSFLLALVTLGEGWHNNHHQFPGAARQGFLWWQIDVSFYLLKLLSWLGVVWGLHPVPARAVNPAATARPLAALVTGAGRRA